MEMDFLGGWRDPAVYINFRVFTVLMAFRMWNWQAFPWEAVWIEADAQTWGPHLGEFQ